MSSIVWSERAKQDYWNNIDYLQKEWTVADTYSFIEKVDKVLSLLTKNNLTFKPTNYRNTYQATITKQISLFYLISSNNTIVLLRFWNTYQNPDKLNL